ncbi:CsbD family protein [Gluconacetobacter azotocaptans]|uniref:CsbD family protein n=1 Tax=Gluconacetobacter azotocaptans TaxID=142834 RepID=A0A7W4JQH5_9PROT|nr:CsbD family protein [Gluconacetobacter azotocaptans]MBB2189056.1 CsbD family protein [Gluconacetobacter azotocaptans]MBM9402734.1 CsbD family protein [Gluconacetobacter azotocaptans]GBQ26999.1 stress response protein CsbD [Gluconacetobacter azotocaptans DSM 13594]
MGELKDKAKGHADTMLGEVKRGIGKATNNPELEAKGAAQKMKGQAEKAKGGVKGTLNKL